LFYLWYIPHNYFPAPLYSSLSINDQIFKVQRVNASMSCSMLSFHFGPYPNFTNLKAVTDESVWDIYIKQICYFYYKCVFMFFGNLLENLGSAVFQTSSLDIQVIILRSITLLLVLKYYFISKKLKPLTYTKKSCIFLS